MVQQKGKNSSSKAKDMLRKAKKRGFPTILARWQEQESYRSSLKDHDIGEQEVIIHDRLALERHGYTATKAERVRYSQNWVPTLNAEGKQHLDNYAQVTKKQNENGKNCNANSWQQKGSSLHPSTQVTKDVKIRIKDLKNMTTLLIGRQDGGGSRSSRETCCMLRLRRLHHGKIPLGNGSHGGGIPRNMMSSGFFFKKKFLSVHAG